MAHGVNFITILRKAFMRKDTKSAKKILTTLLNFTLLGFLGVKAACKMHRC